MDGQYYVVPVGMDQRNAVNVAELGEALREQAEWCERLGSPLYQALLGSIADNVEAGGVCWKVLESHAADPRRSLLPLRFLARIHRLVLEGRLPEVARYYPSAGGTADPDGAWIPLRTALEQDHEMFGRVPATVQTNEVRRCCGLTPGFLEIAHGTRLPLRLLEIGCSAGLNLRWDRYRYETKSGAWGDVHSEVVFHDAFTGSVRMDAQVEVVERSGCDLHPIDPATEHGRLSLLSFAWPDQTGRFAQLGRAIEIARRVPAVLERADAGKWLAQRLAGTSPGVATVVFHSVVWLYLSGEAREQVTQIMNEAGERASAKAPLAWLSMEAGESEADIYLTLWPGGERRQIARAGYHGRNVVIPGNGAKKN